MLGTERSIGNVFFCVKNILNTVGDRQNVSGSETLSDPAMECKTIVARKNYYQEGWK